MSERHVVHMHEVLWGPVVEIRPCTCVIGSDHHGLTASEVEV